jgi:hypothetical protein
VALLLLLVVELLLELVTVVKLLLVGTARGKVGVGLAGDHAHRRGEVTGVTRPTQDAIAAGAA